MQPFAYTLEHIDYAKKKAKRLKALAETMSVRISLSQAQETTARLLGFEDWAELVEAVAIEPKTGVVDASLDPKSRKLRHAHQRSVLANAGWADFQIPSLLEALASTGRRSDDWRERLTSLRLCLHEPELAAMHDLDDAVRRFEAARVAMVTATRPWQDAATGCGVVEVGIGWIWSSSFVIETTLRACGLSPGDHPWLERKLEVHATEASLAKSALDRWLDMHGPWPFLPPIEHAMLRQRRNLGYGRSESPRFTAFPPEPSLQLRFWPKIRGAAETLEAPARFLGALLLSLRRLCADNADLMTGPSWNITFRERSGRKETAEITAPNAATALAWLAVGRSAVRRLDEERIGRLHIRTIDGPLGTVDVPTAVAAALVHPLVGDQGIVPPGGLRAVARRTEATPATSISPPTLA